MSETSYYIGQRVELVPLGAPADLLSKPDVAFEIAEAPDGLPMVLHVSRRIEVRYLVLNAIRRPEKVPDEIEKALSKLESAIEKDVLSRGVITSRRERFYETRTDISSLLGTTLVDRMLGTVSPMVLPENGVRPQVESRAEHSALFSLADLAAASGNAPPVANLETPAPTVGREARLRLSLTSRSPEVIAAPAFVEGETSSASVRPVVWESLLALRSARFIVKDSASRLVEGRLASAKEYRDALRPLSSLGWSVSRADVGTLIFELARSVDAMWHARGRVHGDLKPANVLLLKDGIRAFDALDVASGDLSVGLTASWAAPEQVLARPVTPATDVFALALMIVALLGAAIYGEEKTVIIPARGAGRRRIQRITDPEIWIDPTTIDWPVEARVAWREFLMRCLSNDPERRPQRGNELAAQLLVLTKRWEIPGRISVSCGPGRLDFFGGTGSPVWVLGDTR